MFAPVTADEENALAVALRQTEAMWADDEASRSLGIQISDVRPGHATATLTVRRDMVNGHGICHGGYLFLLADTAFAFACNTHGPPVVAAGADVSFLAPARQGDVLVAVAAERVLRGRTGLYDVTVRREGETILEFRGRSHRIADGDRAWRPTS